MVEDNDFPSKFYFLQETEASVGERIAKAFHKVGYARIYGILNRKTMTILQFSMRLQKIFIC